MSKCWRYAVYVVEYFIELMKIQRSHETQPFHSPLSCQKWLEVGSISETISHLFNITAPLLVSYSQMVSLH